MDSIREDARTKARILDNAYGHVLERPVVYTQGVALTGRLELASLDDVYPNPRNDIEAIVREHIDAPEAVFDASDGTANYAGVNWASLMADDARCRALLIATADRFMQLDADGFPSVLDRDFRVEDMFFAGTILQRAALLTGDTSYTQLVADFVLQCADRLLQSNGIFWHCLSSPYFWGRGNGFAALGYSETLIGYQGPQRSQLIERHVEHLNGLREYQDSETGMWRQVIDMPTTYTEGSSTCMIGIAIATGLTHGWLDSAEWNPVLERAWRGFSSEIDANGNVPRICIGTGPLATLNEYVVRDCVTGHDERGGAMALWFATEVLRLSS